jgi:hypothetical protein
LVVSGNRVSRSPGRRSWPAIGNSVGWDLLASEIAKDDVAGWLRGPQEEPKQQSQERQDEHRNDDVPRFDGRTDWFHLFDSG